MSYREHLVKQIQELERRIALDSNEKSKLEQELNRLRIAEFEEEMREGQEQRLLKG
jgi:hypothetical protein